MRVLVVADLHYTLPQYDWVQACAGDFDGVVIAGDLLELASPVSRDVQLVSVLEHLRRLRDKTQLFVCSGNHDLTGRDARGEKSAVWMTAVRDLGIPCDGDCFVREDLIVSVCPWWDGPCGQREVAAQLADHSQQRHGQWVWIYHAPPANSPTSCVGSRTVGDSVLREWIGEYQPDAVLCGHIHNAPFLEHGAWCDRIDNTLVFNPGRQIGPVPTHIVLDTEQRAAAWHSMLGVQQAPLG